MMETLRVNMRLLTLSIYPYFRMHILIFVTFRHFPYLRFILLLFLN